MPMRPLLLALLLLAAALAFSTPARAQEIEEIWECPKAEVATTKDQDQYACLCKKNWKPKPGVLEIILARHKEWLSIPLVEREVSDERRANLCHADLRGDRLAKAAEQAGRSRVNLRFANLNGALLYEAELNGAELSGAKLNGADLRQAKLNGANLWLARLNGADLDEAKLNGANLQEAMLNCLNPGTPEQRCADLFMAELNGANLKEAELNGASLRLADMTGVIFEPVAEFSHRDFRRVVGLHLMRFEENPDALVKLRQGFKEAGRRDLERQITYAIKRSERLNAQEKGGLGIIEAGFNFVLFEFTTEWGMSSGRALIILVLIVLAGAVFYVQAVYVPTTGDGGVYRLWDDDGEKKKDWVKVSGLRAVFWALYFSLISAFHIGFRELNIGNWIQRINPHDYSVRATGWVKTLSGVQSVLSVYLLAIWALTYFGRPFD